LRFSVPFGENFDSLMAEILKFRSPGRINLIGEHTDYNQGFVLPAAINRTLEFEIQKSTHAHLAHIQSIDMEAEFTVDLNRVTPGKGWENYLLGVLHQIQQRGKSIPGFTCRFSSDLPSGAGLSSSAALECGLAWGLNQLFQLGISEREIIELSQAAEHT